MILGAEIRGVQIADQSQRPFALLHRDALGQVQIQHRFFAGAKHGGLIVGRQKPLSVHGLTGRQGPIRIGHDDVGGQGIRLRTQPIGEPGSHAGRPGHDATGEEFILCRGVDHAVTVAGANNGQVIHAGGDMGKQIRHFDPALSILAEGTVGPKQFCVLFDELILCLAELRGSFLSTQLVQQGLGVEGFEVTRPPRHVEKNDGPRLRRQMRGSGC